MNGIFISYRRDDSAGHAGRVGDHIRARFGARVFQDVDGIPAGDIFENVLEKALNECQVALIIIGRTWLTCTDERGRRRLDDPDDWVRIETRMLLNRDIRVIPVLVGGASMPHAGDLPEDLRSLVKRQNRELRDTAWDADVEALLRRLSELLGPTIEERPTPDSVRKSGVTAALVSVTALALVAAMWFLFSGPTRPSASDVIAQPVPGASISPNVQTANPSPGPESTVKTPPPPPARATPVQPATPTPRDPSVPTPVPLAPTPVPLVPTPVPSSVPTPVPPSSAPQVVESENGPILDGGVYRWDGRRWLYGAQVPSAAARIAVARDGTPWIVGVKGEIYRVRNGVPQRLPGLATDIGAGGDEADDVWIIGTDFGTYKWNGNGWDRKDGEAVAVTVDRYGVPWVVNKEDKIFRLVNAKFEEQPLARAHDISANDDVWIIGTDSGIYKRMGGKWPRYQGAAVHIAAGESGKPWVVNEAGEIYRWDGRDFVPMPGAARDIDVNLSGVAWIVGRAFALTGQPPSTSTSPVPSPITRPAPDPSTRLQRVR